MHDIFRAYDRLNDYVEKAKREKRSTLRHGSSKRHTQEALEYEQKILAKKSESPAAPIHGKGPNDDDNDFEYYPVDE